MSEVLSTVTISIYPDPTGEPHRIINDIPWYPGLTVLNALVIADAMFADTFTFRIVYKSFYGAWVDSIDGVDDTADRCWMLYVDGVLSDYGVSDTVLRAVSPGADMKLDWKYEKIEPPHRDKLLKLRAFRAS